SIWCRHLDTRRFRFVFDVLLSLTMLRAVYVFLFLDFLPRRFGRVMRVRMDRCFSTHANRDNPYARLLLLGEPTPAPIPPEAADIELGIGDVATYLEAQSAQSFDGFTLSNILDGVERGYRDRLFA